MKVLMKTHNHFFALMLSSQSKETFRALLRSDIGESVPFSTLHNRSQVYNKITGRRLASARLNYEKYVPDALLCRLNFLCQPLHTLKMIFCMPASPHEPVKAQV
jgi:hypothetical protein